MTWVHEEELTPGHRAALARARRISAARARLAVFRRHGAELPVDLVETLRGFPDLAGLSETYAGPPEREPVERAPGLGPARAAEPAGLELEPMTVQP